MRLIFTCLLMFLPFSLTAQEIVINELYNSSGSDEWIELLVVGDNLDIRNWDMRDFTSGGTPQDPLIFSSAQLWSNLRTGTVIVVAKPATVIEEDLDPSDFLLVVKTDNGTYLSGNEFLFAGTSDAIQIRTQAAEHVFGISWGSGNAGSLPEPRIHFPGSSMSNTSISFNEDSLPELTDGNNWTLDNSAPTPGEGNTLTNSSWIVSLRNTINGAGAVRVDPDTLAWGQTVLLQVVYYVDPKFPVNALRIILPPQFLWSRLAKDVTITGMVATINIAGDTISLTDATISGDSATIFLHDLSAPDSTAFYPLRIQSRITDYGDILPLPVLTVFGLPEPVANIRANDPAGTPLRLGQLVTVQGIVTAANEFHSPSYVQDNSGGIAIFDPDISPTLADGDEIVLSGIVSQYNGLTELTMPVVHSVLSTGNDVQPLIVTCFDLSSDGANGLELFEGLLVRINVVTVEDTSGNAIPAWTVSGAGTNYRLIDSTGAVDIRIDADVDFVDEPAPQSSFDVTGIVGQYKTAAPFIGGYELLPRSGADILANGPIIATEPVESEIEQNSITINWTTVLPGTSRVRYGLTDQFELGIVAPDDILRTQHSVALESLSPATIYHVQAFSAVDSDTSFASDLIVSTGSPDGTTGTMNVYFNRNVYQGVSTGEQALGDQDLTSRILARIEGTHRSIDATLYNLDGTPGTAVADALISAYARGIRVRVICEADNRDSPSFAELESAGIPLIDDRFDPGNNGAGFMHDKFFVFDYRGGAPESVWVWTGSWNPTELQTTQDDQNVIEIQDVALAGSYTLEFNEMWGSDTDIPDPNLSRFGFRKLDNTPHRFVVGGVPTECYFSPGDRTTFHITTTLALAERDIAFALFSFTLSDVADLLVEGFTAGLKIRGVMESGDPPEQFSSLQGDGLDVHLEPTTALLHHKYAIVDATKGLLGSQWVITGSQNWSFNGENRNNENTLIIESSRIANLFLQEFAARYYEAGGDDSITTGIHDLPSSIPTSFALGQNFPNPFNPGTTVKYQLPNSCRVVLKVYDLLGSEVTTLVDGYKRAGNYTVNWDGTNSAGNRISSGVYLYHMTAQSSNRKEPYVNTRKMLLLK